ncbi:hypothetical protein QTP70_016096, partial [Hemibagrus guttatus]
AAPDAPNPSPSHKVRSSDGSWGGARNVERPVGGARSRARHLGGEREAKARRVGGSEDQGEASGGNEDQGKVRGGSEKQERDKWGEQRTRRQGQRVRRDVHNRAEVPNDVHSRAAEPSDVHSRAAGPSDVHRRAAAPSDVHRRALAPSDVHRRTTAPWRRCPSRWGLELPKGREGGSKVQLVRSSADNSSLNKLPRYLFSVTSPISLFIIVIYRPPGPLGDFLEEMDTLLSVFLSDSTPLMVLGDFTLPSDKLHSSGLLALLNSFSLSFNSCPPTHKEGNWI